MNIKFNSNKPLILDGGMGQTLIKKGMKSVGTMWSATALLDPQLHSMVVDTHKDFIKAGARVIVTNNFTVRKLRLKENNIIEKFEVATLTAAKLAVKARNDLSNKNDVLIAGSIPTRNQTYRSDFVLSKEDVYKELYESVELLNSFVDIFYLDVFSSIEEIELSLKAIKSFNKSSIIGVHIKKNGNLPDGNTIKNIKKIISNYDILGIVAACVDQRTVIKSLDQMKLLEIPYGFKINAYDNIPDDWKILPGNPIDSLGIDKNFNNESFINFSKICTNHGASIIGGCCEVMPSHIRALSNYYKN